MNTFASQCLHLRFTYPCVQLQVQNTHSNARHLANKGFCVDEKFIHSFTYLSRRKIFLQGCPPEMRCSHARRPAATLPTRFSIKQANNTIPTPINKWSFQNKVLYTNPLAEATHHTLMGTQRRSKLCLSPFSFYLWAKWETDNLWRRSRGSGAFTSSLYHHLLVKVQRRLCFMID